jgi:hypothetical protein
VSLAFLMVGSLRGIWGQLELPPGSGACQRIRLYFVEQQKRPEPLISQGFRPLLDVVECFIGGEGVDFY